MARMEIPPERYPRREHSAKVNEYSWGCRRRREAKHANVRSINIYAVRFVRCVVPFVCVSAVSPSMFTGISTEKRSRWKTPLLCLFFHSLNSLKSDNSSALASDELRKSRVRRTWANSFSVFLLRSHHDEERHVK